MTHILIAEDDPAIAQLLEGEFSERLGATTQVIPNGALVTDAISERRPDLLVLDVALPGLSGLDVFDLVRSAPAYRGIPIVFLTANPDQARSAAGQPRVIAKPFDCDVLISVIGEMLGRASAAA